MRERYFVLKLPVADDRFPSDVAAQHLEEVLRLAGEAVIVTEWLRDQVRSRGVELP